MIRTSFRLPLTMIQRLDALAARLRRQQPAGSLTRADVLRMLVELGLERSKRSKRSERSGLSGRAPGKAARR